MILLLMLTVVLPLSIGQDSSTCNGTDCHPPATNFLSVLNNGYRTLSVSSTCGEGGTTPYQLHPLMYDSTVYNCTAGEHPAEHLYDRTVRTVSARIQFTVPIVSTYWQSKNSIQTVGGEARQICLTLNLTDTFFFRKLTALFVAPKVPNSKEFDMRPKAMNIQTYDNGVWSPKRYYAENCATAFPGVPIKQTGPDTPETSVTCRQLYYSGHAPTQTDQGAGIQEVKFNPTSDKEHGIRFLDNPEVLKHYQTSGIRLCMTQPAFSQPLQSYYVVADWHVEGNCVCYGHANECIGPNAAQCKCEHNTMGNNCDKCKPLFNNKPWRPGANQRANECEDCGCSGRALSCHYDVAKGYGVCDDCTAKSTGDKCQFCVAQYYVNPQNTSQFTAGQTCQGFDGSTTLTYSCADYCIPCNCSQIGTLASSGYTCENSTGQCSCKANVDGRRCDTCKDEFWDLKQDNPAGCQACNCVPAGTVNNTKLCNKTSGLCVCKNNTEGATCNQCKAGFFNFLSSNLEGCESCDCDIGGATSSTCPVSGGQCPCRSRLRGRTCRSLEPQYYVPRLDDLTTEPEYAPSANQQGIVEKSGHGEVNSTLTGHGFVKLSESSKMQMNMQAPKTAQYTLVLRYETEATASVSLILKPPSGVDVSVGCPSSGLPTFTANVPAATARGSAVLGSVCMVASVKYALELSVITAPSPLLFDSVVLLPVVSEMPEYINANEAKKAEIDACWKEAQKAGPRPQCEAVDFSIMAAFYDGAIQCSCNFTGSTGQTCAGAGGQCPCAPGVMLKDCSRCKVNHYGFSTTGCKACNCHPTGSTRLACDNNGDCGCKTNVIGKTCNACRPEHYGLFTDDPVPGDTGDGCIPCGCNMTYSIDNSCQDKGQCPCKPGVGGRTCDQCLENFYNLTPDGCTNCNCHPVGSLSSDCAKDTGQCPCKAKVNGTRCDRCVDGYYALGTLMEDGCLPCFCSGHSSNCTSADGWYSEEIFYDWSFYSSEQALSDLWSGVDDKGEAVEVVKGSVAGTNAQFVTQIVNEGANIAREQFYFHPTSMKEFLGDRRGAYATNLTIELSLTFPAELSVPSLTSANLMNGTSQSSDASGTTSNATESTNTSSTGSDMTGTGSDATGTGSNDTAAPAARAASVSDPQYVDSTAGDVILVGTSFKIVTSIKSRPGEQRQIFTIPLLEKEWRKDDLATGTFPTYAEMMMVLSDIKDLLVRAKYSNAPGARTSLFSVKMIHASQNPASIKPVNKIEQCTCPAEYIGQYCDKCAPGFTREVANGGPFVKCVPCKCNNHGKPGMPCNPESGACNCMNNTEGINCEMCQEGYFGNATVGLAEDCKPCMCPGNVVLNEMNAFATSCQMLPDGRHQCINCSAGHEGRICEICQKDFYGRPMDLAMNEGKCLPCNCNGRADTCNSTTGVCTDCRNNTAGPYCNICAPKYHGNAMAFACKPCNCSSAGATGDCNHENGQCVCKPGVEGFLCDRCEPNTYEYSKTGCKNCSCHPLGALGQSCNSASGQCLCKSRVTGRACDKCEDTYWNVSANGCQACGCTPAGTATIAGETFGKCNVTTGQCICATGALIGRTCNLCAKGTKEKYTFIEGKYIGEYPTCKVCGECFDNWARKIDKAGLENQDLHQRALTVWTHYSDKTAEEVLPGINGTQKELNDVASSVNKTKEMLNNITIMRASYDQLKEKVMAQLEITSQMEASYRKTNLKVTSAQAFNGLFVLEGGGSMSPGMMLSSVKEMARQYNQSESRRENAWSSISLATDMISNTSNMVQMLTSKVNSAKILLEGALRNETSAKIILDNDKNALETNKGVLENATKIIQGSPSETTAIWSNLNVTNDLILSANDTLTNSEKAVIRRRDLVQAMVDIAGLTKSNLTLAKETTDTALEKLNAYVRTANDTKGNVTEVFQNLVRHFNSLQNVTNMIANGTSHINDVNGMTLRPLAELRTVTSEISSFSLAQDFVDATFSRASQGQTRANQVYTDTKQTLETTNQTLQQVKAVMENLNITRSKNSQVLATMNAFIGMNLTIGTVLKEVNAKSQNVDAQTANMRKAMADTDSYMGTLEANLSEKKLRMAAVDDAVKRMQNTIEDVKDIQQGSTQILASVTNQASKALTLSGQNYNELLTGQSDLEQIRGRLNRDIGGASAVESLYAEIDIQRSQMIVLESDINRLNIEMDQVLSELEILEKLTKL